MRSIYQKFFTLVRKNILLFATIAAVGVYLPLLKAYFQQDEWYAFGFFFSNVQGGIIHLLKLAFAPNVGHFTPLYYLAFYIFMFIAGAHYQFFFVISLFWHIIIFVLLFQTIKLLTSNKTVATLTSVLFLFGASSSQATSWVVADTNTHGSTFFGLLALYLVLFFMKKRAGIQILVLSILCIFVSLFFKEVTIGLFGTVAILVLFVDTSVFQKKLVAVGSIGSGILYILFRAVMFLLPKTEGSAPVITQTQTIGLLLYNTLTFPAKTFFQAFFPPEFWLKIGRLVGRVLPHQWAVNTSQFSTAVNEKILDPLFIVLFIAICIFTLRRYLRLKTFDSKVMMWALLFVIFNSVIYAFSPERSGIITFLDSRNLYFTSIGSFLWFFAFIYKRIQEKNTLAISIVVLLFISQLIYLHSQFSTLVSFGQERQLILNQIVSKVPSLADNTVIYVESDTPYYGLSSDHTTPPFQSGFGHTLLVTYTKNNPYPAEFYSEKFLWPLASEGYLSKDGKTFGYYSKFESLRLAVKKYNISVKNIYAFSWQGGTSSLLDITDEVRTKLVNQEPI